MALERLQILVDGNAQGAIREFEKLGQAADRELGKTDDRLNRISASLTSFGTGLLAGGAVAIGGLKQLANSASDYGEQVSAATVIFGEEGAAQLEQFAEAASDTANISKTEATKAANSFATFARQAGLTGTAAVKFSTDLVQLAGDISSFRDISVADALAALQSGLAGEGEPIRRLGGDISDVALKAEYLAVTGEEVSGTLTQQQKVVAINSKLFKDFDLAQGDVIRTSDSLANKTRNAEAEFENLKTELGQGLVPIFTTVVSGIGGVVDKFRELPAAQQDTLSKLAGFAAFGSVAVGALSLVAGQVIKLRDAFTTLDTNGVRSLTNIGKAAAGIGIAGTVIGSFLALDAVLKNAGVSATDLKKALDDLRAAETPTDALNALLEATKETDNAWSDLKDALSGQLSTGGVVSINGVEVELNELRTALDNASRDTESLKNALEGLRSAKIEEAGGLARLLPGEAKVDETLALIDEYEDKLNSARAAQEATTQQTNNFGAAADNAQPPVEELSTTVEGLAVKTDDAKNAFQAYSDTLRANTDPFFAVIDAASNLGDAQQKVADAYIDLFTDGATAEEFTALADAQRDAVGAAIGAESAIAALRGEVEAGNIQYDTAITTLDTLAQKYPQLAPAIGQVKDEFFLAALAAQGLQNTAPIELPVNAQTEQAVTQLQGVVAVLEAIATAAEAVRLAELFAEQVRAAENAQNRADIGFQEIVGNRDLNGNGVIGRRRGGPVNAGDLYMVGEAGPELFRPRTSGSIVPNNQLGGSVNITQNISSPDPLLTAAEVVRRQRDAEFLAGV